ncbi:MAG: hypothetical protein NTW32_09770 [Chloroflexi bacterium]|nr:hypothetical protein [Chloroflexota bacterium]
MSMSESLPAEPKKNRTGIIIAVVLIVLCCCCVVGGGIGYWLWNNGDSLIPTGALIKSLSTL